MGTRTDGHENKHVQERTGMRTGVCKNGQVREQARARMVRHEKCMLEQAHARTDGHEKWTRAGFTRTKFHKTG